MKKEKEIFDLVYKLYNTVGDEPTQSIHVLDHSDEFKVSEDDYKFRVYALGKYCFDIEQERNHDGSDGYDEPKMFWTFQCWDIGDGFESLNEDEAIVCITKALEARK